MNNQYQTQSTPPNEGEVNRHTVVLGGRTETSLQVAPTVQVAGASGHVRRDRILAMVVALLVTGSVTVGGAVVGYEATKLPAVAPVSMNTPPSREDIVPAPSGPHPYMQLSLEARAYVVYDVHRDRILASSNEQTPLPLASLTKVMTSLIALENARSDTRLAISPRAIETEGDSGLFANETWQLKDLVSFMMVGSSNDGADAIASAVGGLWHSTPEVALEHERVLTFVERMNTRAEELGLSNTSYRNASGLDVAAGVPGGTGTALDTARLFAHAWKHEPAVFSDSTLQEQQYVSEDGFVHTAQNTNEHVTELHGMLGSKTGYTELAGGNLGIIYNSGMDHPIVVVVLGSTLEGRFEDVEDLVDATYAYIESGWYEYEVAGSSRASM